MWRGKGTDGTKRWVRGSYPGINRDSIIPINSHLMYIPSCLVIAVNCDAIHIHQRNLLSLVFSITYSYVVQTSSFWCIVLCCFVLYYLLYFPLVILWRSTVWGDSTYTGKVNQHLSQKVTLFHPPLMTLSVIQSVTLHRTSFPVHLNANSCHLIYFVPSSIFVPSFFTMSLSHSLSLWLFPTHSHSLTHTYTLSLTITYSLARSLTHSLVRTYVLHLL